MHTERAGGTPLPGVDGLIWRNESKPVGNRWKTPLACAPLRRRQIRRKKTAGAWRLDPLFLLEECGTLANRVVRIAGSIPSREEGKPGIDAFDLSLSFLRVKRINREVPCETALNSGEILQREFNRLSKSRPSRPASSVRAKMENDSNELNPPAANVQFSAPREGRRQSEDDKSS